MYGRSAQAGPVPKDPHDFELEGVRQCNARTGRDAAFEHLGQALIIPLLVFARPVESQPEPLAVAFEPLADGAHVVDLVGHGHQEYIQCCRLLQVFDGVRLALLPGSLFVGLRQGDDQVGHLPAERQPDFLQRHRCIFERVVQDAGDDQMFRAVGADQDSGHRQRVDKIRDFTALAHLAVMSPGGQLDGIVEFEAICFGDLRHIPSKPIPGSLPCFQGSRF